MEVFTYRRPSTSSTTSTESASARARIRFEVILRKDFQDPPPGIPGKLRFERVVRNELMFPCRLRDFMNYLRFGEHNAENLKFYLWYMDYTKRWEALPEEEKALCPEWTKEKWKNVVNIKEQEGGESDASGSKVELEHLKNPEYQKHPFRAEVYRICSLFLTPNAPLELNVSTWERTRTLEALVQTTHPMAFLPVFQSVDYHLRYQSHPNFILRQISLSRRNPYRAAFSYFWFLFLCPLAIVSVVLLILSSHSRWWRILSAVSFWFGGLAFMCGWRGMCALLFLQRATIIDPWDDPDDFALSFHKIGCNCKHAPYCNRTGDEEAKEKPYQIIPGGFPVIDPGHETSDTEGYVSGTDGEKGSVMDVYHDGIDVDKANMYIKDWNENKTFMQKAWPANPKVRENDLRRLMVLIFMQHSLISLFFTIIFLAVTLPLPSYGLRHHH